MRTKGRSEGRLLGAQRQQGFHYQRHYADVCVAMAVTDRAASHHGVSAFILEKGRPGFVVGKKENKLGMRASATGEVIFTDCRCRIATARQARRRIRRQPSDSGWRPHLHRGAFGRKAQGAYEAALKYSKQRKQFGRPISEFQSIQNKLADMATEIDAARLLTYRAGWIRTRVSV